MVGGASLVGPRYRVELQGSYWFPRTRALAGLSADVVFRAATISLRGCARFVHGRAEVPLCGGLVVGALAGVGSGLMRDSSHTGVVAGVVVSPGIMFVPKPWFVMGLRADLDLTLARPQFSVRNYGPVFRPPPLGAELVVSLGVRF